MQNGSLAPRAVAHVVATNNFAGVERYLTYVAPLQAQLGWRVTVVGGATSEMRGPLEAGGVEHVPFHDRRQAQQWLREHTAHLHLVHAHMTDAEVACVRAVGGVVPVVATRHFARPRGRNALVRLALRSMSKRLAAQVSISQFVASTIGEPSVVIPNGVPNREAGSHHERVILVAQRLEPEKSTDLALRAFAASGLASYGWQLHIAGRGSQESALRWLAGELGISGAVQFLGFVGDVAERLSACSIVLAPAPAEPFGLTVAEAMACAAPVCASRTGGHGELFEGLNATTFEPGDVFGAAAALRALATDEAGRRELGAQLQQRQRADYSLHSHVERLDTLYRQLADG